MSGSDILIYATPQNDTRKRLQIVLEDIELSSEPIVCHSVDCLNQQLKKRSSLRPAIVLLSVGSQAELDEILAIHTPALFREVKVILILPGHDRNMTLTGLRLQPRFLTYADSDFTEITKVLAKMTGLTDPCCPGPNHHEEMTR
jgi:hypothetical protein